MAINHDYFKVPNEFIEDLPRLSEVAIKLYLVFRKMVNENRNDGNLVFPSYSYIHRISGMSNHSIKKGINELLALGWIKNINKGFNRVNKYYLNDKKSSSSQNALPENIVVPVGNDLVTDEHQLVPVDNLDSSQNALEVVPVDTQVVPKVETNNTNNNTNLNNTKETILINNTNNNDAAPEINTKNYDKALNIRHYILHDPDDVILEKVIRAGRYQEFTSYLQILQDSEDKNKAIRRLAQLNNLANNFFL